MFTNHNIGALKRSSKEPGRMLIGPGDRHATNKELAESYPNINGRGLYK